MANVIHQLLVVGNFGAIGPSTKRPNTQISVEAETNSLWHLPYDGTPKGFHQAWLNCKAEVEEAMIQWINAEAKKQGAEIDLESRRVDGVKIRWHYLSVIKDFGSTRIRRPWRKFGLTAEIAP
ncbi:MULTISPECIES: hypothetical protein [Cyanophyceae]|uniref:hypothetical protein n=1 Tax=Cyanophyceae TaxID=3028117 RepID=UPI001683D502|nr:MULTISPECIES: hypothetical protein [Cyanophyceae]MBD1918869.1 hypothetical protein [Phormidium sp. FACHB-77]MBD2033289.1 hypothetical protein [Phormidium sp. FACHB-322]MBD2053778.1 hypothetical protein [Leptolyngbya sp. FACHB-60]